jgi:hypothetical protein
MRAVLSNYPRPSTFRADIQALVKNPNTPTGPAAQSTVAMMAALLDEAVASIWTILKKHPDIFSNVPVHRLRPVVDPSQVMAFLSHCKDDFPRLFGAAKSADDVAFLGLAMMVWPLMRKALVGRTPKIH